MWPQLRGCLLPAADQGWWDNTAGHSCCRGLPMAQTAPQAGFTWLFSLFFNTFAVLIKVHTCLKGELKYLFVLNMKEHGLRRAMQTSAGSGANSTKEVAHSHTIEPSGQSPVALGWGHLPAALRGCELGGGEVGLHSGSSHQQDRRGCEPPWTRPPWDPLGSVSMKGPRPNQDLGPSSGLPRGGHGGDPPPQDCCAHVNGGPV